MPKIMKAGKVLTSNSLNGEIILSENIRKQNELDRIANEATRANVVEAIEVEYAPRLTGVESQLAERATKTELNVEKTRITNLATLAVGSTTGDAELIDARVGADGVVKANLGEAIRGQIAEIKTKFTSKQLFDVSKILYNKKPAVSYNVSTYDQFTDLLGYNTFEGVVELPNVAVAIYVRTNLDSNNIQFFGYKADGKWDTVAQLDTAATVHNADGTHTFKIPYQSWAILRYLRCGFNGLTNTTPNILIMYENEWDATADSTLFGTVEIMKENVVLQDTTKKKIFDSAPDFDMEFSENTYNNIKNGINSIVLNPCAYEGEEITMLAKGVFIGDSLTQGIIDRNDAGYLDGYLNDKMSVVANLSRLTGLTLTNKGDAGKTFKAWWDAHLNDDLSGHNFAVIALGVNDGYFIRSWTADALTALTNIVNKLKAQNNGIKIFIATMPRYFKNYTTEQGIVDFDGIRTGIKNAATSLGLYLIDLGLYSDITTPNMAKYAYQYYGHFTPYGYFYHAKEYKAYISYIIANNQTAFKNVGFVGTTYSFV